MHKGTSFMCSGHATAFRGFGKIWKDSGKQFTLNFVLLAESYFRHQISPFQQFFHFLLKRVTCLDSLFPLEKQIHDLNNK